MKKYPWLLFIVLSFMLGWLSACGGATAPIPATENKDLPTTENSGKPTSDQVSELSVYNWADYIDPALLTKYEKEYGVKIIYDTFASNEDLISKLQAGATGYDVVIPSDYAVATISQMGLLAEIDKNNLPNLKNIDPKFLNTPHDPDNKHCIPYQWGTTGIAYNRAKFSDTPPDSWAFLFDPAQAQKWKEAGGINLMNDQRELIGAALKYLGYSLNDRDEAHLKQAKEVLIKVKPYIKSFNSEDYKDSLLVPGEVIISQAWSGDAFQAISRTTDEKTGESTWAYIVPKEGGTIFQDMMCIPASSQRKAAAEQFINFLLDAQNGAAITNHTYYPSPNVAAKQYILPEILNNPSIYPPQEVIDKLEWVEPLGEAVFVYDQIWTEIKSR